MTNSDSNTESNSDNNKDPFAFSQNYKNSTIFKIDNAREKMIEQ